VQFYIRRELEKALPLFQSLVSFNAPSQVALQRIASMQLIFPDVMWGGAFKPSVKERQVSLSFLGNFKE